MSSCAGRAEQQLADLDIEGVLGRVLCFLEEGAVVVRGWWCVNFYFKLCASRCFDIIFIFAGATDLDCDCKHVNFLKIVSNTTYGV